MNIKPTDKTIKNLLESGFYKIPRFQRPYSWGKTHVEDFWDDSVTSEDPDYFIGSFVLYPEHKDSDTFMIVDGQQRLTTITILLAVVRNALRVIGFDDLAKGIQKRIETEDIDNKLQYILQSETSYPYLQEHIQKYGQPELPGSPGSEENALKAAFDLLTAKVKSVFDSIETDASIAKLKKDETKRQKLLSIRDKLLRLQLITVQLTNEDDAYLIFETLNTRGMNLGISDLLKNHLTRLMRPINVGVDVARDKWEKVRTTIDESAADLDINRFIYHSWLSRYPYVGQAKQFPEIKKRINKLSAATAFLDHLVEDSQYYRTVLEPTSYSWTNEQRYIKESLRALNMFRVLQPVPLTLTIIRDFSTNNLTTKQTRQILLTLEKFHAQFTGVTSQRTGGGTARMYAASAEDLTRAKTKDRRSQVLKEFVMKLRKRVPRYEEFEANLGDIIFLSDNTREKPIVQYLLGKIGEYLRSGTAPEYTNMTIEHISAENPKEGAPLPAEITGALGNLILVTEKLNVELANKPFARKKQLLEKGGVPLDTTLQSASVWGEEQIQKRTKDLANLLHEKILKV